MGGFGSGRKRTIGNLVIDKAAFGKEVAAIVQETGAKPDTVRSVLRRASVKGEFVLKRFVNGKGNRRLVIQQKEDQGGVFLMEQIFFGVVKHGKTD